MRANNAGSINSPLPLQPFFVPLWPAAELGTRAAASTNDIGDSQSFVVLYIDIFKLNLARHHRGFPFLMFRFHGVKLRHHFFGKQFQAVADVFVGGLARLIEQNNLIDIGVRVLAEFAPNGVR